MQMAFETETDMNWENENWIDFANRETELAKRRTCPPDKAQAHRMIRNAIITHCFRHKVPNRFTLSELATAWAEYAQEHKLDEPSNMAPLTVTLLLRGFLERLIDKGEVKVTQGRFSNAVYEKTLQYAVYKDNKS